MMPYTQSMRLAVLAGFALTAAPVAQAADLGATVMAPTVVESWTGFYVGGGGGVGFLNTDLNSSASRLDEIGFCKVKKTDKERKECEKDEKGKKFEPFLSLLQSQAANFNLGDEGFFGTVQLGYDKQFAPRWVVGAFVDADWYSDLKAKGHQETSSALNLNLKRFELDLPLSKLTTDAELGVDWTLSVGGRLGWLANPNTLLYVLGAYTHAELDNSRVNVLIDDPFGSVDKLLHSNIANPTKIALGAAGFARRFQSGRRRRSEARQQSLVGQVRVSLEPLRRRVLPMARAATASVIPFIKRTLALAGRSKAPPRRISMMSTSIPCAACSRTVSGAPQK